MAEERQRGEEVYPSVLIGWAKMNFVLTVLSYARPVMKGMGRHTHQHRDPSPGLFSRSDWGRILRFLRLGTLGRKLVSSGNSTIKVWDLEVGK